MPTSSLDLASLAAALPEATPSGGGSHPHESLATMLQLALLVRNSVCGDGNCAYYAAAAAAGAEALAALRMRPLDHAGTSEPSASDMKLQKELRRRCVDWLELDDNAEHRHHGTTEEVPEVDPATGRYREMPPPPASAMQRHRTTGTYAQPPQLRALAEVLGRTIVSLDSAHLYDRVPVYTPGHGSTLRVRSWRRQLAPVLRAEALAGETAEGGGKAPRQTLVLINNGQLGSGAHYDATKRRPLSTPTVEP